VAALEDLAQQFAPSSQPPYLRSWNAATELKEFQEAAAGVKPEIAPELNGPYLVTNVTGLENSRGEPISTRPQMALCRCGGSANKPFCDGTHAAIGFESEKLEGRIPDRRDVYTGKEITVFDNRGICQHAGFCTDKLPSVFKLHREPWIDPNGAPPDVIAAQIQQCPSGALALSASASGDSVQRTTKITVSKDGPYRVSGAIHLRSKNKPFYDGTHWYNHFSDDRN
jgi:CDGSH-type Zn-finger protein